MLHVNPDLDRAMMPEPRVPEDARPTALRGLVFAVLLSLVLWAGIVLAVREVLSWLGT